MAITLRDAVIEEVPVILELIQELAEYERMSEAVLATREDLEQTLFGPDPKAQVILAWDGDTPVGLALYFENYSTFLGQAGLYLEDLIVLPTHRGAGVGKLLMVELAKRTQALGYERLSWVVLDWNEPAIGFYRKLGAVPMDDWLPFRLSGDALTRLADES